MNELKIVISGFCGVIGGIISSAFGGWGTGLTTLAILMIIDYISGWLLAAVFKKSKKSENGTLSSAVGWKGLCKKGMTLAIILVAYRIDLTGGTTFVRDAVIIGFIINEGTSVIENAGLMGLPVPSFLMNAIDILHKKAENMTSPGK